MPDIYIERLDALIARGDQVIATHKPNPPNVIGFATLDSGAFTGWRSQVLTLLQQILGSKHVYIKEFEEQVQRGFPSVVEEGQAILRAVREDLQSGIIVMPQVAAGVRHKELDVFQNLDRLATRLHAVVCQLRSRYDGRGTLDVSDEYDAQDLLHALLHLFFDDIRPEEWTPSYAGKSSRVDFLLKNERTVVELKKTRPGLTGKEIGTQLNDDIARYEKHPDCGYLFCIVYDPDHRVTNPRGFENDLARESPLRVRVRVVPQTY
ncbi:MAG TPA: hypothetical protein VGJ81_14735 [Thermoanaerobaculia bacterium]|jgi:hypothetical protein